MSKLLSVNEIALAREIVRRQQVEICALIPAYNEARHIERVVKGCLKHLSAVYVVDDGSTDRSGEIAREAGAIALRHSANLGKGAALKTGFARIMEEGRWDGVIVLDGDGQHDWEEIPRFLSCLEREKHDIVLGNRMGDTRPMPFRRKATNCLSSRILSVLTGQRIEDSQCGFRLMRTEVLERLALRTTKFDTESEMLVQAGRKGFRLGNLRIATIYGAERSHVRPVVDTLRFLRVAAKYVFRGKGRRRNLRLEEKDRC